MYFRVLPAGFCLGSLAAAVVCVLMFQAAQSAETEQSLVCSAGLPEEPALTMHLEQDNIVAGRYDLDTLIAHGKTVFEARFNACDGQGRPAVTGIGQRRAPGQPRFIRTSGPDANSCAGCHDMPRTGGAGDIVANAFVLSQAYDPVITSIAAQHSNERNTPGMFGSGAIEMLAREMTDDLLAQADGLPDGDHVLTTKGVDFPITLRGGKVVTSRGVDTDLIIKPFHQSGVVRSIREFTVSALNHHHGIQAEERFDLNMFTGFSPDFDADGVERELTVGDVTAITLFQAALGVPGRLVPSDPLELAQVRAGEAHFSAIGCASCHVPEMRLNSAKFREPYGQTWKARLATAPGDSFLI